MSLKNVALAVVAAVVLGLSAAAPVLRAQELQVSDQPIIPEHTSVISPVQAAVLGLVEGLTEYLPVSSTGHLVLAGDLLGLRDKSKLSEDQFEAIEAYEIVIQSGAILAVLFLYSSYVQQMLLGLFGKSVAGRKLLINVMAAFMPAAVIGFALHSIIKRYLQASWPVIAALIVGGIWMIVFERSQSAKKSRDSGVGIDSMTLKSAVQIGFWQCLAMWPGTSRSMTTIVGGMITGLSPVAAAEFSFILGLPTLLAATGYKLLKDGPVLVAHVSSVSMLIGLGVAAVSAALAVRAFVAYLTRRGLAPFGWYRIIVGIMLAVYFAASV